MFRGCRQASFRSSNDFFAIRNCVCNPSQVLALTPSFQVSVPPTWASTLRGLDGESVELTLAVRRGSGAYKERAKASVVVTPDTVVELSEAARELVASEGLRSADFQLCVVTDNGKRRKLAPVRIRAQDGQCSLAEPDPESAFAAASTNSAVAATNAALAILTRENAELRAQVNFLLERLVGTHEQFSAVVLDHSNARAAEHAIRAAYLDKRDAIEEIRADNSVEDPSTVADHWWQSEPLCTTIKSGIENVTQLTGLIAASMAGVKVP